MNIPEQEAILTVSLMAGFADGAKNDAERAEFKRIAESLPQNGVQPVALYHRVLLKRTPLAEAVAPLRSPELRQLAYEMAVCICDADGTQTDAEKTFLSALHQELKLDRAATEGFEKSADALAVEPLPDLTPVPPPVIGTVAASDSAADAETDKMVLNYAILNGALELMPESLATMAIVPLQMKMVYRVGKRYGHELDRGHIKELLAAAGVGLTSQVVEGYARKLLGGLLGKVGGGMVKSIGNQTASSAMSFAATYALGKMAKQYYAGGRKLSAIEMRQLFGSLTEQARGLHANHAGAIREKTGQVSMSQLLQFIRAK